MSDHSNCAITAGRGSGSLVDILMPRVRARADRCDVLTHARVPGVATGIVRMRDRGGVDQGWLTREEMTKVQAFVEESVDAGMERWARSLLVEVDGEVRKLTEEEVQAIAYPSAGAAPSGPAGILLP